MSRLPRAQEHLKTGFTAEAVSAAHFRAYAARAEREGREELARRWRELAVEKDRLAIAQLEAAGRVHDAAVNVGEALAEERYENEVLYPKLLQEVDGDVAEVLQGVLEAQARHADEIEALREELVASP